MSWWRALRSGIAKFVPEVEALASESALGMERKLIRDVARVEYQAPEYVGLNSRNVNSAEARLAKLREGVPEPTPYTQADVGLERELGIENEFRAPAISKYDSYFEEVELPKSEVIRSNEALATTYAEPSTRMLRLRAKIQDMSKATRDWLAGKPFAEQVAEGITGEIVVGTRLTGWGKVKEMWRHVKNSASRATLIAASLGITGITLVIVGGTLVAVFKNNKGKNEELIIG